MDSLVSMEKCIAEEKLKNIFRQLFRTHGYIFIYKEKDSFDL